MTQEQHDEIVSLLQNNILPRYIFIDYGYPLEWAIEVEEELKLLNQPIIDEEISE